MQRRKMTRGHSKRLFTRTARRVHPKNIVRNLNPMRGGYRF